MTRGCFRCTNQHLRPLGTRAIYATIVVFSRNRDDGEYNVPAFGFTVSLNDNSYRELTRYHWIRYLISGGAGVYSGWTSYDSIEDEPTLFVRLFNGFDGQGVQHKHSRVNVFDYVEDLERGDLWAVIFEPHHGRPGLYVDPVEELLGGRMWGIEEINSFVHTAFTSRHEQKRMANYYWNNAVPKRLTQLQAGDTLPEVEENDRRRLNELDNIIREAREAERRAAMQREQQRLIEAGAGRRPEVRGVEWNAVAGNNANAIIFDDGIQANDDPTA